MPTDPFVPTELDERPRQGQNLPAGMSLPPARSWRADRPGDLAPGWPEGTLLGSPGPNVGYAMKLVHRVAGRLVLTEHESRHDALIVVADLAMRRAAGFGRAPIPADVEVASALLGYDDAASDVAGWRAPAVAQAAHDYPTRRAIVDAVPEEILRADVTGARAGATVAQAAIRAASVLS